LLIPSALGFIPNMASSRRRLKRLLSQLHPEPTASSSSDLVLTRVLPSGVGVITLNNPPVNSLPHTVVSALDTAVRKFQGDPNVKAVIVTGQKRFFCGGADITKLKAAAFGDASDGSLVAAAHPVLNNMEDGNTPMIAAINGFALGGGCELAMGCHYRIMSTTASIGLVEANLGLIPGFGGTQRMPRLMGLDEGIYAILTAKQFKAEHAVRRGLCDEKCAPDHLMARAEAVALEFANKQRTIRRSLYLTDRIPDIKVAKEHNAAMRKRFAKLFHASPAAEYALTAIMGIYEGPKQGLRVEIETFDRIIQSPSAKGQLHLFFAQRATTKIDIPIKGKMSRSIGTVAVLGGGTMGSGVAALLLSRGLKVILKEVSDRFMQSAHRRISKIMRRFEEKGKLKTKTADEVMHSLLTLQTDYSGFDAVDLVIEAVLEKLPLKQRIFKELAGVCRGDCILATNTSTIDLDAISEGLDAAVRSRVIGLHFFSPAHIMALLEIIRTDNTSPVMVSDMVKFSKKIGKIPVVVGNCVGFAANRMFFPYCQAAHFLIEHGVDPYRIDRVLEDFGMAMGVSKMMDLSGVDIFSHVEDQMRAQYPYCYDGSLMKEMVSSGRLGQKKGAGMYRYDGKRNTFEDGHEAQMMVDKVRRRKKFQFAFWENALSDEDIVEICLFPVVNEAYRILAEQYAHKGSDLDIVSQMGYGFPKKRGGVHFWGTQLVGLKRVVSRLQEWSTKYHVEDPNLNLCQFFAPCPALVKAAHCE